MKPISKSVAYRATNRYETLNPITTETKNIWVVFHGIGYLSKYFLKYFDALPKDENYIIAPQAPSKYYLKDTYTHVGASWLTKIDTEQEIENVLAYLDQVWQAEAPNAHNRNIIVMGFSQGVSIALRWLAKRSIYCNTLIIYAGSIPEELEPQDFDALLRHGTRIFSVIGDQDRYLTPKRLALEKQKLRYLFKDRAKKVTFKGGHEVKKELLQQLVYGH